MKYICEKERNEAEEDALLAIARGAEGGMRDALSLLDQCAANGGAIDTDAVLETLGLAGNVQTAQMMECILRRDAKAALLLLNRLYAGGKDVGAVLGEIAVLARDLLISTAAPEGGASLLSGGYDANTMKNLLALGSGARFIQISTILQTATAELQFSVNRRTDAELCLLKLCDETLSGDLTALGARIARLEEQLAAGVRLAAPAPAPAPAPESERNDVPWDEPPLEEKLPLCGEPAEQQKDEEAAPSAEPAVQAQASEDGDMFAQLMESYKNRLAPDKRAFIGMAKGRLQNDTLTVYCAMDLQKNMLDQKAVTDVLEEVTSRAVGREIKARVVVGEPEGGQKSDPMEKLMRMGSKFDNFTIK